MKFFIFFLSIYHFAPLSIAHDRVIVGVLTIEISKAFEIMYDGQGFTSYLPASYVKWVEQGGARTVPIYLGMGEGYYRDILSKVNGVLLPGGFVDKNKQGGYAEASGHIMRIASELNNNGDFLPIFGIGAGMDLMLYHTNDEEDIMEECQMDYMTVSLTFTKKGKAFYRVFEFISTQNSSQGTKQCALYNSSSDHVRNLFTKHPVAVFNSKKCYIKEAFEASDLSENWNIFSLNIDQGKRIFVSGVEHKLFPFYGVMFHPEKIAFEW